MNTVWILPIQDVSRYSPRDYYAIQQGLGTADEFRALIDRAHQLGLHVLQDCVPHGGRSDYPRAKQHPEWLAYKEDGSTLVYWCFDFNWPTWRDYMAGVRGITCGISEWTAFASMRSREASFPIGIPRFPTLAPALPGCKAV